MSIFFRPTAFSGGGAGDASPIGGLQELAGAGISAGVETQLSAPQDVGAAHQFFQPTGAESAAAHAIGHAVIAPAGAEAVLAGVPGANEPISPLIQLIMRMPGHIGLLNAFFETLASFFHLDDLMHFLNPALMSIHAHVAQVAHSVSLSHISAEHFAIDPSILPHDAPILQGGGLAGGSSLISQIRPSEGLSGGLSNNALRVSSDGMSKVQFEGGKGEVLSGPSMSDATVSNHLAPSQRMFADRVPGTFYTQFNPMKSALNQASATTQSGTAVTSSTQSAMPVGDSAFNQTQASSAAGQINDGVSSAQPVGSNIADGSAPSTTDGGSLGPSGAVGNHLNDQQLLAQRGETFHPSLGSPQTPGGSEYGANYLQTQPADTSSTLGGLKAKPLSLDGTAGSATPAHHAAHHADAHAHHEAAAHHPVMDQVSHETNGAHAHHDNLTMDHQGHQVKAGHSENHAHTMDQISHVNRNHVQNDQSATPASHQQLAAKPTVHHHHSVAQKMMSNAAPAQPSVKPGAEASQTANPQSTDATTQAPPQAQTGNATTGAEAQPGTDAASAQPAGDVQSYTVHQGDNLWNIARTHLGSGFRWQEIYNANHDLLGANPDLIKAGTTIQIPGAHGDLAHSLDAAGQYTVKAGDNLWNISKGLTGDPAKWSDLYKANADVVGTNPNLIVPGQHLSVPGAGHASSVASTDPSGSSALANSANPTTSATAPQTVQAPATSGVAHGQPGMEAPAAQAPAPSTDATAGAAQGAQSVPQTVPVSSYATGAPGAASAATLNSAPSTSPGLDAASMQTPPTMPVAEPIYSAPQAQLALPQKDIPAITPGDTSPVNTSFAADLAAFLSSKK